MPTSQDSESSSEQELTQESPLRNNSTIEELKLKLGSNKETDSDTTNMIPESNKRSSNTTSGNHLNDDGLIIPRKLPNPILDNPESRSVHRELLFNQKIGRNVLNNKSELEKIFDNRVKDKKGQETHSEAKTQHELEKAIADRAKRRQDSEPIKTDDDKGMNKTFLEARAKLRTTEMK